MNSTEKELAEMQGAFVKSLRRNNKQIKDDRALSIAESAHRIFKRTVEDLTDEIKQLTRERDGMLDLGGNTTTNIISLSDFNAQEYVSKDLEIGVKIRLLEVKLEIATKRYNELFVGDESAE